MAADIYYADVDYESCGPVTEQDLRRAWDAKRVHEKCLVWWETIEGADWVPLDSPAPRARFGAAFFGAAPSKPAKESEGPTPKRQRTSRERAGSQVTIDLSDEPAAPRRGQPSSVECIDLASDDEGDGGAAAAAPLPHSRSAAVTPVISPRDPPRDPRQRPASGLSQPSAHHAGYRGAGYRGAGGGDQPAAVSAPAPSSHQPGGNNYHGQNWGGANPPQPSTGGAGWGQPASAPQQSAGWGQGARPGHSPPAPAPGPHRDDRSSWPDGAPWHGLTTDAAIAGIVTPAFEAAVRQLIGAMAAADSARPLRTSALPGQHRRERFGFLNAFPAKSPSEWQMPDSGHVDISDVESEASLINLDRPPDDGAPARRVSSLLSISYLTSAVAQAGGGTVVWPTSHWLLRERYSEVWEATWRE